MSELLFKKTVDQSLLKSGATIPKGLQDKLLRSIGISLKKGEKQSIRVLINGNSYDATLTNVDFDAKTTSREVIQIRYAEGSAICRKLKEVFTYSVNMISEIKVSSSDVGKSVCIPESTREYVEVYAAGPATLEFKCLPKANASIKADFFQYLGSENDLSGYQRSYKLVFYKCFFALLGVKQEVAAYSLTQEFKKFYVDRKSAGLVPDVDADPIIKNIDTSSPESVYKLILKNPFAAIHGKGFITQTKRNEKSYFVLDPQLREELSEEDVHQIIDLVDRKLAFYFSKIDRLPAKNGQMRDIITKILNEYSQAKNETFAGHSMGTFFRNDIPNIIYNTGLIDSASYLITGSVGQGNWATVPWVCIFDRSITTSATKGIYIVYLLSKDCQSLYLTFNQGCTDIRREHSKRETIEIMREKAREIAGRIDARGFRSDEEINLGSGLTELAELYQKGTIFYKEYKKAAVPSEEELQRDLSNMMEIYADFVSGSGSLEKEALEEIIIPQYLSTNGGEEELSIKETVSNIKNYIAAKGFSYEDGLIENFYLSLKSKPFVILAGTSGTGKTRLAKLFAEAVGATTSNDRYKMVSVRPDWSDSSDLFGHVDLNSKFVPGAIIGFVKQAEIDRAHPYFLCLDEMNLARVEYYLSDVLSVIETRDFVNGKIESDPLVPDTYYGADQLAAERYGTVRLPENLYIIGTVNMDETTFPFSRKVLDRANTIEFSYVDLMPNQDDLPREVPQAMSLNNAFLKTEYLLLGQCTDDNEAVNSYCLELQTINRILQKASAHVGYRVRDEIVFYLLNNKKYELLPENEAMDNELMQKILPRIQGSSTSVKNMLCELFKHCAGDYDGYQAQSDNVSDKMRKALNDTDCKIKYRHSAEKIELMTRRFEEDGFTSYWL